MSFEKLAKMGYIEGFIWAFILTLGIWLLLLFFAAQGIFLFRGEIIYSITGLIALWLVSCVSMSFVLFDLKQQKKD